MMPRLALILILALTLPAAGQATRPTPVAVWFQPTRNVPMLRALGVDTFIGPEVESPRSLTPEQLAAAQVAWIKAVADAGAKCILKNPPAQLPGHCVGVMLTDAEANRNNTGPSDAMKAEAARYRAAYPGVPIFVDLAGDKISSANFDRAWEKQVYVDYGAISDVAIVNSYPMNRNANRYPLTWTADVAKKYAAATGDAVWPAVEMNDQRLAPPTTPGDVNRAPTPDEIQKQVDACLANNAAGIVWFATCDSGKYGWGTGNTDFATRGDSYWPLIDRNGVSMAAQIAKVGEISKALTGKQPTTVPTTNPSTQPTLADLQRDLDATRVAAVEASRVAKDAAEAVRVLSGKVDALSVKLDRPLVITPATQPTQP